MRSPDPLGWVGSTVDGQFAVESVAGIGGYGVVYRATHLGLDAPIALKCLLVPAHLSSAERERFVERFRTEARILHRLSRQTANIVQALDVGAAVAPTGRWTPYIVMEWLDGQTLEGELAQRIDTGLPPRSMDEAIQLLAPVAEALSVAHEDNVSHRDVKPGNLFLTSPRGGPRMKVLDFGIAKVFSETPSLTMALGRTSENQRVLTPLYAAPEQFTGDYGASGPWTDVFAMALILIEVASGRRALDGGTLIEICIAAVEAHSRSDLFAGVAGMSSAIADVLRRALAPKAADRFRSMSELWSALQQARRSSAGAPGDVGAPAPAIPSAAALKSAGENRVCTVMIIDLSSVGELSARLDGEELKDLFDRCLQVVREQVDALGGMVDGGAADRNIAVFGVPRGNDDDAERAVVAALSIQAALGRLPLPRAARSARLAPQIGIHTGRVFARIFERGGREELGVVGEPVRIATRLQEAAPAGGIVITRDTYRAIAGRFNLVPFAAESAAGKAEPPPCYLVVNALHSSFASTDFHGIETKLVGRAAERERIAEALETATSERRARFMTLTGPPGVGRSRLLADLFGSLTVHREHFLVLMTQCSPLSKDTSYSVAAALLRRRFDIREGDSPARIRRKLRIGLRWFRGFSAAARRGEPDDLARPPDDPDPAELDAALTQIEGILGATARRGAEVLSIEEPGLLVKHRIAAATSLLFRFVAQRLPVVMLCDDLQWADDASLDLLSELVHRGHDLRVFALCSARPELLERRPDWGADDEAHERVEIAPLPRRHVEEICRDRLRRVRDLPPDLVRLLADRAEGNPLILTETLHLLLDAGAIEAHPDEAWVVHPERLSALALPTTIQRIVQARLDRLDPEARSALAYAAVIGRTFWQGALEHLRSAHGVGERAPGISTEALVTRLRDRHLVRVRDHSSIPGEREAMFAEAAMQEVAYEMLSVKVRRALHLEVAAWLEQQSAHGAFARAALLALHYDRGGDAARASAAHMRAAAHDASLGENAEALRHLERARAIHDQHAGAPHDARGHGEERRVAPFLDRVRLRLDLGDALRRAGRLDDAEQAYEEARALVLRFDRRRPGAGLDPAEVLGWDARIDARQALVHKVRGSTSASFALFARAIGGAVAAGLVAETPVMYAELAFLLRRELLHDESWQAVRTGLRICRHIPRRDERWIENVAMLLLSLGNAQYERGRPISAERTFRQVARLVQESTHPHLVGWALNGVGVARLARGDLRGTRETFLRALRPTERAGDLHQIACGYSNLAEVELKLREIPAALAHARRAVQLGEQVRAGYDLADMYRNLAEALLASGELGPAIDAGLKALAIAESSSRFYLRDVALTLARSIAGARRRDVEGPDDSGLHDKVAVATAALTRALEAQLSKGDGELRSRAEECRALLEYRPDA